MNMSPREPRHQSPDGLSFGTPFGDLALAKKPNYNFEKNRREQDRKNKQEEKRLRKLENSRRSADEQAGDPTGEGALPPAE
jgi:hypothetical protein